MTQPLALLSRTDAEPAPLHAALVALTREISELEDPHPALRRWATAFLAVFLDTGKPKAAVKEAAKAVASKRDTPSPPSLGRDHLGGAAELDCLGANYPYRVLIHDALTMVGRLAASDRGLVPWLFEAIKQWASAERIVALEILRGLDVSPTDLAAGLAEVLRFAGRFSKDDKCAGLLRDLTRACRDDPAWTLALLRTVECDARAGDRLIAALYGSELGEPLLNKSPAWLLAPRDDHRRALDQFIASADPVTRTLAVILLAQVPGADVRAPAVALLAAGGWPARQVVTTVLARDFTGPDVVAAIAAARANTTRTGHAIRDGDFAEALTALERAQAAAQTSTIHVDGDWIVVLPSALVASPPVVRGAHLYLAYHRVVRDVPRSEWMTAEDALGFFDLSLGPSMTIREIPLPLSLPMTRTGASGARRAFELATMIGESLVCTLKTPFADDSGWGNRNYLFAFTPGHDTWQALTPTPAPIPAGARESALTSLDHGELIVWEENGALKISTDGTPYHLDDWEFTPETRRSFDARRAAEARLPWHRPLVSGDLPTADRWPLADGRALLGAHRRIVACWPAAASGRLYGLHGVSLPDGRVALTIRRFAPGEPARDILLIAPAA